MRDWPHNFNSFEQFQNHLACWKKLQVGDVLIYDRCSFYRIKRSFVVLVAPKLRTDSNVLLRLSNRFTLMDLPMIKVKETTDSSQVGERAGQVFDWLICTSTPVSRIIKRH